jgi:hypothetical protein
VLLAACLVGAAAKSRGADGVEQVTIVIGPQAVAIERFAAAEMVAQFQRVFHHVDVTVATSVADGAGQLVLLGSPNSNPAVDDAVGADWPEISDQGIVIRRLTGEGAPTLVVGGGSPTATLWAAYELGHRLGIRYLLLGDTFPNTTRDLDLSGPDLVMEPKLPVRTWSALNDLACGTPAWSLAEHRKRLHQLAKLKFNRVMLAVTPW